MFGRRASHDRESAIAIRSDRDGDVHHVKLIGELEVDAAAALDAELRRVESGDAREIVVDLSDLSFISAEGLKAVIRASARSVGVPGRLRLVPGSDEIQKAFETAGLISRLPFDVDRDAGRRSRHQSQHARLVVSRPVREWLSVDDAFRPRSRFSRRYLRWPAPLRRRREGATGKRTA
jgi:anti-anti-sigma factor